MIQFSIWKSESCYNNDDFYDLIIKKSSKFMTILSNFSLGKKNR